MFQPSTVQWNIPSGSHQPTERHGIKRKNIIPPDTILPPPPEKHFVTEDEMTAEMRRLQIMEPVLGSNTFPGSILFSAATPSLQSPSNIPSTLWSTPGQKNIPQTYFQESTSEACTQPFYFNSEGQFTGFGSNNNPELDNDMESEDLKKNQLPRLFISGDVFKVEPEPILPEILMNSLPNRNMALVPWVPPILPAFEDETELKNNDNEMDI